MLQKFTDPAYRIFNLLALVGLFIFNLYNEQYMFALFFVPALIFHAILYAKTSEVKLGSDFYSKNNMTYNIAITSLISSIIIQLFQNDLTNVDITISIFLIVIKYVLFLISVVIYFKLFSTILKY